MLEDIRESGEEGVCEEQEEDPIRLQLWDAESKDSKVDKGIQDHKDAETKGCRNARAGRKLHQHFQATPFPP